MSMSDAEFDALLDAVLKESQAAFQRAYGQQLSELSGLSSEELEATLPGTAGREAY